MKCLCLVLLLIGCCWTSTVRYDNYRVYRTWPKTIEQLDELRNLENQGYEFWAEAATLDKFVDVMIGPDQVNNFEKILNNLDLEWSVLIQNIQDLIDHEQNFTSARSLQFNWNSYQSLNQINAWLEHLEKQHPGVVTRVVGGRTYEKRDIYGVRVSFKPGNRAVFLEGGIHAREWISPATVTYILNELLTSTDPKIRAVAESRDWYVFPCFNPDGYDYTLKTNRMWRKTRSRYFRCYGADPNRNWDYHWMDGGASFFPCNDKYAGPSAFSEVETKTLSHYISSIASELDAYIAFHSYSQMLLIPFGHRGLEKPQNNDYLHRIGRLAVDALFKRYGTEYTVGNVPEVIYVASGGSMDWVAAIHNITMVYTFELRDTGCYGYILPAEQIIPTGQETLDALVVMIEELNAQTYKY